MKTKILAASTLAAFVALADGVTNRFILATVQYPLLVDTTPRTMRLDTTTGRAWILERSIGTNHSPLYWDEIKEGEPKLMSAQPGNARRFLKWAERNPKGGDFVSDFIGGLKMTNRIESSEMSDEINKARQTIAQMVKEADPTSPPTTW